MNNNPARIRGPVGEWWHHQVPAAIIGTYRRIPDKKRTRWSMGSSTSHLAAANPSWETLFHYGTPNVTLHRPKVKEILAPVMLLNSFANGW